jgi:hypothetical protein
MQDNQDKDTSKDDVQRVQENTKKKKKKFNWGHGFSFLVCFYLLGRWRPARRTNHSFRRILPGVRVCLTVCNLHTSTMRWSRPDLDCCATEKKLGLVYRLRIQIGMLTSLPFSKTLI